MDALTIPDLERLLGATIDRQSLAALERSTPLEGITREMLAAEIAGLRRQREEHLASSQRFAALAEQASGAIQAYEALLKHDAETRAKAEQAGRNTPRAAPPPDPGDNAPAEVAAPHNPWADYDARMERDAA